MRPEHQPTACFSEGFGWTHRVRPKHRVAWDTCPPHEGVDRCQPSTPASGGPPLGPQEPHRFCYEFKAKARPAAGKGWRPERAFAACSPVFQLRFKTGSPSWPRERFQDGPPCFPLSVEPAGSCPLHALGRHVLGLLHWLSLPCWALPRRCSGSRPGVPVLFPLPPTSAPGLRALEGMTRVARWAVCGDSPFGPIATARGVTSS